MHCFNEEDLTSSRILIVDDQDANVRLIEFMLDSAGFQQYCHTTDSRQVLHLCLTFQPDILLLDLQMPRQDGFAVMEQLARELPSQTYLPILVLTADISVAARQRALSSGADDFLSKPLDTVEVILRIKNLLRTRHLYTEVRQQNEMLKTIQTQLIQQEKMASLGQLVAGIAHEINNPLAFVLNHLFLIDTSIAGIASDFHGQAPDAARRKLEKIRARLEEMRAGLIRVKDLVRGLRTFSRLDEAEVKTIDIHESIDSVLLFLRHKMHGRIELEKRYGTIQPFSCYAGRLNQVMMNLVANAIDAIEAHGKIVISTREEGGVVIISVRDTGMGIPEAIRGRIFDPFFTTKPIGQGTGLGLAISYQIIQAHGGSIEVQSEVGIGTEFSVRIPCFPEARSA